MSPNAHSRSAFTLLEALLALAVSILVITITYSAYHTVIAVRSGTEKQEKAGSAAMQVLNLISRDLMCGAVIEIDDPVITLSPESAENPGSRLEFVTAIPDANAPDPLAWYTLERTTFYLEEDRRGARRLLHERTPLFGPDARNTQTNLLLERVDAFNVRFLHNNEWLSEWPADDEAQWPRAARLELTIIGDRQLFSTDVFLPVGNVITSSVNRNQQTLGE
jgi:type II secretion system protein J